MILPHFKNTRHYRIVSPRPHLLDDVGVGLCDLALHAQRVSEVQFVQVQVPQEVVRQLGGVAQTLRSLKNTDHVIRRYGYVW